jgi:hypothetical protein
MEPTVFTHPALIPILDELKALEPIFHTPSFENTRNGVERVTDADFWEVGASGQRYSREHVVAVLKERGITIEPSWTTKDFWCREAGTDTYLLTYTLFQAARITRRCTLWRRTPEGWKILYHQGTIVQEP